MFSLYRYKDTVCDTQVTRDHDEVWTLVN